MITHVCLRPEPHGRHLSGLGDSIQCPGRPEPAAVILGRLRAALEALERGDYATAGRDFGRGVAHAVRVIRQAEETE